MSAGFITTMTANLKARSRELVERRIDLENLCYYALYGGDTNDPRYNAAMRRIVRTPESPANAGPVAATAETSDSRLLSECGQCGADLYNNHCTPCEQRGI